MPLTLRALCAALALPTVALALEPSVSDPLAPEVVPVSLTTVVNPAFPTPIGVVQTAAPTPEPIIERADLAPYFAEGQLAEAKKAYDCADFQKARVLLDGVPNTAPVKFLRALSAYYAEDNAFASVEFEALAETWPVMKARSLVYAGWAYESLKQWEAAQRVFSAVDPQSRVSVDAQLGLARALKYLKKYDAAKKTVAELANKPPPAWGRDVGAEALMNLADLAAFRGDTKNEQAALIAIWSKHPMSPQAVKAEPRIADHAAIPPEALVSKAENLVEAHQNAEGLALVQPILETVQVPDPVACRAQFIAAKAQRKLRQHAAAVELLVPVVQKCKDPQIKLKALYTLGFSRSLVSPSLSVGTFDQLLREFPDDPLADDSAMYAAEVQMKLGNANDAVNRLLGLVEKYPNSDSANDALFKLFWLHFNEKNPAATFFLDVLEARNENADDSYEVERARYWRARYTELEGHPEKAVEALIASAREHPATYYGLMSREAVERLAPEKAAALEAELFAAPAAKDAFPLKLGPLATDAQFLQTVELLRLGLTDLVPMEVVSMNRAKLPRESLRVLVLLLSLAGDEKAAHGMARLWLRKDLAGAITEQNRSVWEIAYPKVFRDMIETHSTAADGLDPDLLQGLMREESALDPKALSWAGAMGLCQLMPATAAGVAMQLKLKRPSTSQLLEPDLNIRLGARYLADLVKRLGGVAPHAIASYNAGESAVARWKSSRPEAPLDMWVEEIPLQETRGYVKRVLRSYNTYKLLYSPGKLVHTALELQKPQPPEKSTKPKG